MIVETENLGKRFDQGDGVRDLTLAIPEGTALALLGANGAGKTTTLRLLVNLLRPDEGRARVLGVDSRRLSHRELAQIGYVSENQVLPGRLSVAAYFDYLRALYPTWDVALETHLRRKFDLPSETRISALSRGGGLKLAVAAALPYRPRLLLLDEPFSGLDSLMRDEVVVEVLKQAGEMTIIISSHDLAELESFTTDIAFLQRGRLLFQEPAETVCARFRAVTMTLDQPREDPVVLPPTWLEPKTAGRMFSFVDSAFGGERALAQAATTHLGPIQSIEARPMPLVGIAKSLMSADRGGAQP